MFSIGLRIVLGMFPEILIGLTERAFFRLYDGDLPTNGLTEAQG